MKLTEEDKAKLREEVKDYVNSQGKNLSEEQFEEMFNNLVKYKESKE